MDLFSAQMRGHLHDAEGNRHFYYVRVGTDLYAVTDVATAAGVQVRSKRGTWQRQVRHWGHTGGMPGEGGVGGVGVRASPERAGINLCY